MSNNYEGSFEQYAREQAEAGNPKYLEEHYQHEDRLNEIRKELVPTEFFCKQFWKDISFSDSNHSSDTVVWYKDQFLTSKRTMCEAKIFADQYLNKLLERGIN